MTKETYEKLLELIKQYGRFYRFVGEQDFENKYYNEHFIAPELDAGKKCFSEIDEILQGELNDK